MYTIRLLNQDRTLLAVLPVISWSYDRKLSEATGISVKIARSEIAAEISTDELFAFLSPWQPALEEFPTDDCLACATPVLAYYLQLYRNTDAIGMGIIAKRDFSDTTISLKAYTEEHLLSLYRTPADYGIKYDNTDICDLARDMLKGWRTIRYKQNWDEAEDSSQVDITTEPSIVILDKDGAGTYYSSGYITFEFERPDDFDSWERIRWSADNEDPVYSTMAYRTWNGAAWSGWSTEYEGALPDQLGIEIGVTDAVKVQVRITLTSADQESEDDAGDPVGSTPALFAVEIIARTTAFLTSSIPVSSSFEVVGIDANEKTSLQVLRDACEQAGWEFQVLFGVLTVAETIGDTREVLFRAGTNMDITQLGDDAAEIINYLIANGTGSGINRPQVTLKDTASITNYGIRQLVKDFEEDDPDDLETAAQTYLDSVSEPAYSWKIKTKFAYDDAPDFFTGDTVTVVDPKSATVQRSRIMQTILSYSNHKLDSECYLGKTRANLVPKIVPIYRKASLLPPKSLALAQIEKGLIASIQTPDNSSLWAVTELYASTVTPVTIEAANLIARKRATNFTMEGLLPKTRYYAVARYVDTYGRTTEASVEVSLETLKFSTPFEDMQPADSDPGTLAFQTNGGNVKIYNSGIIDAIDGIYRGSLVVAVVIGLNSFLVNIDPTNGIKSRFGVTGSEETFFHADINGDVSLGNYDGGAGAKWIKSTGKFSIKGDGFFSGKLIATEGVFGNITTEFLYKDATGTTYTTANDFEDVITFLYGYTDSLVSGSFTGTYGGKTYRAYERVEKYTVRTPNYNYTYYFYATDGTTLTQQLHDSLASDFNITAILNVTTVNSDMTVMGELTVANIYMPINQSLYFTTTYGTTLLKEATKLFAPSTTYVNDEALQSNCKGTVKFEITLNTGSTNKTSVYIQLLVDGVQVQEFSFGGLTVGVSETQSINLAVNQNEILSVGYKAGNLNGGTTSAFIKIYTNDSVIGATARVLAMADM